MYPVLMPNYSLLMQHGDSVLYPLNFGEDGQVGSAAYEFDRISRTASEILALSDGTRSTDEIISILAVQYNESHDVSTEIVTSFLQECVDRGIVVMYDSLNAQAINVNGDYDTVYPLSVQIVLTKACPLKCLHCYNNSGTPHKEELSTDEVFAVLDKIKSMGVKRISLTGGEPTARPDFAEILKYVSKAMQAVIVISNGYCLTEEIADAIKECGNVVVQISLDGAEENHNHMRGARDSYQKAVDSIQLLTAKGVLVMVAITINEINARDIEHVTMVAKENGAHQVSYGSTMFVGRARDNNLYHGENSENITPKLLKALKQKYQSERFYVHIEDELEIGVMITENTGNDCGKGSSQICVRENGDVSPCVPYNLVYGNLLKQEPAEIFHYTNVQKLLPYFPATKKMCTPCAKFSQCGGCEAVAYDFPTEDCEWKQKNVAYLQQLDDMQWSSESRKKLGIV